MSRECKKGVKTRNYYRYYDTPDGCDVDRKILVTTRYGIITGLIFGSYDVLMYSHTIGFVPIIKRYLFHALPLGLMGATFAAVSNGVMHARQEDDHLNYFAGGFACGPILAMYLRSGHAVIAGGLLLGIIAMIKKEAIETNFQFIQPFPAHMNNIRSWRNDYTLTRDPRDDIIHVCESNELKARRDKDICENTKKRQ